MRHDTEKDAINNLQRYLRQLSYTDPDIPAPPIDSIFDSATKNSLKSFQRKYSLAESGIADKETFEALYAAYLRSINANSPPLQVPIFPSTPSNYELSVGDRYFAVSILQLLLNELRFIYDSFIPLSISGIYDEATETNVLDFQSKNGLLTSGRVDKATWDKIVMAYENYAYGHTQ